MRTMWIRRFARPRVDQRGQAVVEFVLIAPILLLMIFGLVDFARAWSSHHAIADAAREGARMLVVSDATVGVADATAFIQNRLANSGMDPANATITYDPADGEPARGEAMTVTIDYAYTFWILGIFMNWATGDEQVNLVSTITMRGE